METPPQIPLDPPPATAKRGRGRPRLSRPGLSPENPSPRRNPRIPASQTSHYYREFREGDLVWARVKTQPHWWPGRVGSYRNNNEGSALLVSLFGAGADDAAAWFEPTELKPFREEFEPMVRQSVAKGFVDAVRAAMDEFADGQFCSFVPEEFLSSVRSVAGDVFACGLLESAVLKSWVYAFVRENGVRVVNLADLVDMEPVESQLEENWTGKGPEITDGMSPRKKKRSMAELIAVPSMGEEEVTESTRKQKQKEVGSMALSSLEVNGGVSEEEIGSPRGRERKKSKYLSPPYTFGSGYTSRSNSFKDAEVELPKDNAEAEAKANPALVAIAQVSAIGNEKAESQMSPTLKYASISADVMLSQLLRAAIEPLKRNGLDMEVRYIFEEFRRFVTSRKEGFDSYLQEFVASGDFNRKTMNDIVDKLEEEVSVGKSNMVEVGASGQAALSIGNVTRKRGRPKKVQSVGENPMNLAYHIGNDSQGKSFGGSTIKKKEDGTNGGTGVDLGSEQGKGHKRIERKILANDGAAMPDFGHNVAKLGTSGRPRKSGVEAPNGGIQGPTLVGTVSNGTEGRATRQTTRKKEGNVATPLLEPKAPLPYLRENLEKMILALAGSSSDVVLAEGLKPEVKENLVYEMHALLHKVKNLQTGTCGTST